MFGNINNWSRIEGARSSLDHVGSRTGDIIHAQDEAVRGRSSVRMATGAGEAAIGFIHRQFLRARVTGAPMLTRRLLGCLVRSLVTYGDALAVPLPKGVDPALVGDAAIGKDLKGVLIEASSWRIEGGINPTGWRYIPTVSGAEGVGSFELPSIPRSSVFHVLLDPPSSDPSRGIGPSARSSATLLAANRAEGSLASEMNVTSTRILPTVEGLEDGDKENLNSALKANEGKVVTLETQAGGHGAGTTSAPRSDWQGHRVGPEPTQHQLKAAEDTGARLVAAIGLIPSMFGIGETAGAIREARAQAETDVLQPLAELIAEEASRYFDREVTIEWPLRHDKILIQSKALDTLVKLGATPESAAAAVGMDHLKFKAQPE